MLIQILKDEDHPLKFLVNYQTRKWHERMYKRENTSELAVQAGHTVASTYGYGTDRLAIEDAVYNNFFSGIERAKKTVPNFRKVKVIKGVYVEFYTALAWVHLNETPDGKGKYLDRAIFENADISLGWSPLEK